MGDVQCAEGFNLPYSDGIPFKKMLLATEVALTLFNLTSSDSVWPELMEEL